MRLSCIACPCTRSSVSRDSGDLWRDSLAERAAVEEMELVRMLQEEKLLARSHFPSTVAAALFPILGILFSCLFLWTVFNYPLLPLRLQAAEWGRRWLLVTVADYYTCVLCFLGIALASEHLGCGILWCLAILLLGAPLACVYLTFRACSHGTLRMVALQAGSGVSPRMLVMSSDRSATIGFISGFYAVAGLSLVMRLVWTAGRYPAYPFQETNPEWLVEWLFTAVGGLCTVAVCLCGLIVSSEESVFVSAAWCLAVLLLGGPGACAYVTYRAVSCRSIMLQDAIDASGEPSLAGPAPREWSRPGSRPGPYPRPVGSTDPVVSPLVLDQLAEVQVQHHFLPG